MDEAEDQRAALLNEAGSLLGAASPPPPAGFADAMFGHASAEDLAPFTPDALARLAGAAWEHLGRRRPRAHDLRLTDDDLPGVGEITALEIVNDDMPFLLDSVLAELADRRLPVRFVVHPILAVTRRPDGTLAAFGGDADRAEFENAPRESLIHLHLDRIDDADERRALVESLDGVLGEVRSAADDYAPMLAAARSAVAAFREAPPPLPADEIAEAVQFLEWLTQDDFVFLGVREYALTGAGEDERLDPVPDTGLGLLRDPQMRVLKKRGELVVMTPEIRAFLHEPKPLIVTKASVKSRVFRRLYMDYVGAKRFDADGGLTGELRVLGLFTGSALMRPARETPLIRRKIAEVIRRAGFDAESHSGRALANLLETYPREELFQAEVGSLFAAAMEVLALYGRPRVKALLRPDRFQRFVSALVYVPRERYDSEVRAKLGAHLAERLGGRVSAYSPSFPEGPLARVHFIIGTDAAPKQVDPAALDAELGAIVRTWGDGLRLELAATRPGAVARSLAQRYGDAFGPAYEARVTPREAVTDVEQIERLDEARPFAVDFYARDDEPKARLNLKVFSRAHAVPLSRRVPMLEDMGFRVIEERTFEIAPAGGARVWLHDMTLERAAGGVVDLTPELDARLESLLIAVLRGEAESDGYNALALEGELAWREVALLRALSRYLRQARAPYDQDYMWRTLVKHSAIATKLVALFRARFDPAPGASDQAREAALTAEIEAALEEVDSLDEDSILRRFLNLVRAMVRTNFFQGDRQGVPRETFAFKFESRRIEDLPAPRPLYDIWVCSPRVEGVHLRFGKVARGGLRWSDRPQDFRTEILGLVKAQQVKNAVIVPVGAKGGFVPKRLPAGPREAWLAEGTEAYRLFINALLDVTDDLRDGRAAPPAELVRHDGDDPYLVVAADKGTAAFSDTANGIAERRGYWLGDAFASGGSAGYDHKRMGITARGAWEAVKRHFREMDVDIQTTPFTVVGVGDMSGDVFGNGMLLSPAIKLIAAFDHRDIFIDPNPDPAVSLEERRRLFGLPRSSWADYDAQKISAGGGVFSRALKSIRLSPEAQAALGFDSASATPRQVMSAILRAPADLLWFGGVGAYVRASDETDDSVGDRGNDAIRIAAADVRAKVIGEGANLGVTQRGRIEAARRGVRLNTDAIDNSAGVNTSDVEVNLKIALAGPVRSGALRMEERNRLLGQMTDEVARLVLRNNYDQTLALSLAQRSAAADAGFHARLMRSLESRGLLDRAVENLPDDAALAERARGGEGLTRPELAVLLAWSKIALYDDILASDIPDAPYFAGELFSYFPAPMRERFAKEISGHRLRREILATAVANAMVNRGGPAILVRLADQTGASAARAATAFAVAREAFRMEEVHAQIDALDAKIPGDLQLGLYAGLQELLLHRMGWFLRNVDLEEDLELLASRFQRGVDAVAAGLDQTLSPEAARRRSARAEELLRSGLPEPLAQRFSALLALEGATDAVLIADRTGRSTDVAGAALFAVADLFGLSRLVRSAQAITAADYYERLAIDQALDQIGVAARNAAIAALSAAPQADGRSAVEAWLKKAGDAGRVRRTVAEIADPGLTLGRLSVAAGLMQDLGRTSG